MPFCHRHPDVQIITDYLGVASCRACEAERRAGVLRQCPQCARPVQRPGLCRRCARTSGGGRGLAWFAEHYLVFMLLLAALLAWTMFFVVNYWVRPAAKAIEDAPAYQVGSAP